ncbi:MAG: NfeD family protein [Actinomycetota bacterium]|nr:NfeD family protein [Actinomycetota bacterium]
MLLTAAIVGLFVLPGPWNVIAFCAAALVEVGELYLWKRFLDRYRVRGGAEGMIGERAAVTERCDPEGRVMVRGEIWRAVACRGLEFDAGERVRVVAVDGLTLRIDTFTAAKE